jgi:ribonuclease-3
VKSIEKQRLCARLGHSFANIELLDLALTHRSCGSKNNERLEFLGDSILGFTIGEALYHQFPDANEGQLSRLRSQLVRGETLAQIARELQVGDNLILGEGERKSGGHRRDSILADSVEAIIGAIHIDAGMDVCMKCVLAWYDVRLKEMSVAEVGKDAKTQLQELLQSRRKPLPKYEVVEVEGEAHAQTFTVECRVSVLQKPTRATANSRRSAEKQAAAAALELISL